MSDESTSVQETGGEVMALVHRMVRLVGLYEANNSAVGTVLDSLSEALDAWFAEGEQEFALRILADECFVNGRLLKLGPALYGRVTDLSGVLGRFSIGAITFAAGCTRQDLEALCHAVAGSLRAGEPRFPAAGIPNVRLGPIEGSSVASFRFQPDRLALSLYSSLLDVIDRLYAEQDAGRSPSLLPVRRLLQMMIDTMREHSGIYQMLTTVRDPDGDLSRSRLRAALSVDLMGAGMFIGLGNNEIMTLALAGLLAGLSDATDPTGATAPLFDLPGLGSTGLALVEAVAGARRAATGGPCTTAGKLLAVAEHYHALTSISAQDGAMSPTAALALMKAGQVPGADPELAHLFAHFKGPYPLGSPVRLGDGTDALVVSQGASPRGKLRPAVAPILSDGSLGAWIDLQQRDDVAITGWLGPNEVHIDLLGVRDDFVMDIEDDDDAEFTFEA
mgnify:CR=1 FL=1